MCVRDASNTRPTASSARIAISPLPSTTSCPAGVVDIGDRQIAEPLHQLHHAAQLGARVAGLDDGDMFRADADLDRRGARLVGRISGCAR